VALAREQHAVDACIANGENAAGGFGLTAQTATEMFESGVDFITSGNHIYDKRDFKDYLESSDRVIRPANYPPTAPRPPLRATGAARSRPAASRLAFSI
jgi:2',3'-cyclic-nucleotide 2'-phosphodiesterase